MKLLEELEILLETRQPYANGNAEKCYPFVAELIQQLRAAQQPLALDGVEVCPICERVHSCFSPCGDCLATRPASKA